MKKLILKTSILTICAIFLTIVLVVSCLTLFSPLTLANLNSKLGNEKLTCYYYERQYNKTEKLTDLENLIYKTNECGLYSQSAKYSKIMVENEAFEEYATSVDARGGSQTKYTRYVYGNYATALYHTGESAENIFALNVDAEYVADNIFQFLIDDDKVITDTEFLSKILVKLSEFEENQILNQDRAYIQNILTK